MALRIPVWGLLLGGTLLGLGMVAASLYFYIRAAETRHWEGMRRDCSALARELYERDGRRPVLREKPLPGNAWDEYVQARKAVFNASIPSQYLSGDPKVDRSQAWEVVAQHLAAIEKLRRGTSIGQYRPHVDWEKGSPNIPPFYSLGNLTACRARFLVDEGRLKEAAELLLDTSQFGLDIARTGTLFSERSGLGILDVALAELREIRLPPEELAKLSAGLEILERNLPRAGDAEIASMMSLGYVFLETGSVPAFLERLGYTNRKISAWRYGLSQRLLLASCFEEQLAAAQRRRAAVGVSWAESWALELEIHQEFLTSRNPLTRLLGEDFSARNWTTPNDPLRAARAQLRLLRIAARYRISGELLELDDPFGSKLRSAPQGSGVKLWSVGPDGVDDGGTGEWKPGKGKDIVLTVER